MVDYFEGKDLLSSSSPLTTSNDMHMLQQESCGTTLLTLSRM